MLQLRIKQGRRHIPLYALPDALGRREAVNELGDQIDALISFLDTLQGDVDLEDGEAGSQFVDDRGNPLFPPDRVPIGQDEDREPDEDALGDIGWLEWHTRGSRKTDAHGTERMARDRDHGLLHEDMEDDDPREANGDEADTQGGEDELLTRTDRDLSMAGPGCPISEPGGGNVDDVPHDYEREVQLVYGVDQTEPPLNLATAQHRHKLQRNLVTAKSGGLPRWAAQITKRLAQVDAEEADVIARAYGTVRNDN